MSQHVDKNDLNPIEWQAETLRLTAFPLNPERLTESSWWEDLVGESPDSKTSQPKTGELEQVGPFEHGKLVLKVQPARTDWIYTHIKEAETVGQLEAGAVGPFLNSLEVFNPRMIRWFEICPPIQRLAFGAILVAPVEDRKAGYLQLSGYLPSVTLDPEGSSDFLYQLNRPRESSIDGFEIKINRLTKWSIGVWRSLELLMSPVSAAYRRTEGQPFCRLELDINTDQNFASELPKEKLNQIFQTLVDLGKEIAQKGDIK